MAQANEKTGGVDGVRLAILANRFDSIARKMTNTLLRTGRSGVLNIARDFSCCIITAVVVVLVGGPSRIPLVKSAVRDAFCNPDAPERARCSATIVRSRQSGRGVGVHWAGDRIGRMPWN